MNQINCEITGYACKIYDPCPSFYKIAHISWNKTCPYCK